MVLMDQWELWDGFETAEDPTSLRYDTSYRLRSCSKLVSPLQPKSLRDPAGPSVTPHTHKGGQAEQQACPKPSIKPGCAIKAYPPKKHIIRH